MGRKRLQDVYSTSNFDRFRDFFLFSSLTRFETKNVTSCRVDFIRFFSPFFPARILARGVQYVSQVATEFFVIHENMWCPFMDIWNDTQREADMMLKELLFRCGDQDKSSVGTMRLFDPTKTREHSIRNFPSAANLTARPFHH